jgi:thiol:disulfide interchange protein DsbD
MDPNFEINTETHEGSATFGVPLVVLADAPTGGQAFNINVRFQACNDKMCLPPRTVKLNAPVTLVAAAIAAAPAPSAQPSPSAHNPKASPTPTPTTARPPIKPLSAVSPADRFGRSSGWR